MARAKQALSGGHRSSCPFPPFQEPRIILSCVPSLAAPHSTQLLVLGEYVRSRGGCREGPGLCGAQAQWVHIFPFLFLETAPYKIPQHMQQTPERSHLRPVAHSPANGTWC